MKYVVLFLLLLISVGSYSQSVSCEPNTDFEYGNFSYWQFYQGTCCIPFTVNTAVTPPSAATTGRETVTSGTGTDPYGGFPVVWPGSGSYSLKLGTDDNTRKADRARYYIHVPSGIPNYALIYRYAIVMQDPGHVASKQPRFEVTTVDSATGDTIHCGHFLYVAGSLPGFSLSSTGTNVYYKPWSLATINLSGYNGHTVIVDFTRGDCDLGAHFGYGYIDMTCGLFAITTNPCQLGATTTLSGPPGFQTYTWMDSSLSTVIDTGQTIVISTPSVSTTYKLILTPYSGYGCTDTLTTRVLISNLALHPRDTAICIGKTATLNAGATGGITPLTYSWTPTSGLSCSGCTSPTISPGNTTKIYVTVTDSTGCFKRDSVRVKINSLPNINAGADKIICNGNSASITATGGSTYSWTPTTGLSCANCSNPAASPISTTNYIVTGTDTNGCVKTDTIQVKVNPLPNVNAGADKVICRNNTSVLIATGATNYSWSPTTGLSCSSCASPVASPTTTTTYVVTGTDTNSCVKKDTVVVNVNQLPIISAGTDKTICRGNATSLLISGGSTYVWTPTTGLSCILCANPTANPISTTTYIATGTDTNGCVSTDTIVVKVNPLPTINAGSDKTICIGNTANLSVTGAAAYVWSPTTGLSCSTCTNPTAYPTSTTTYIVTGTDTNTCVSTDTVLVKVNPLPNVNAGPDKTICLNNNTSIIVTGASTYSWSPTTGLSCSACANPTASPTSTTTYIVTGTDSNSCVKKDTVVVNVNPLPTVGAGPDKAICIGSSTTLLVTGASTYSWSPTTGLSCSACASPTASPITTTTYIVTGTDTNNCVNVDTIQVKVNPLPNVNGGPDKTICRNNTATLTATGAGTYVWSPTTSLSCSACTSPTASPIFTTTYIVTGTDSNSCIKTDTVIVNVNQLPNVNAGADRVICRNDSIALTATGAGAYVWSPTTTLSCSACASPLAFPTSTTSYVVTGTDTNSCNNKDTVVVRVNALPNVSAGPDKNFCQGGSTNLSASGASNYIWTPATGLSCTTCYDPTATPGNTTTYVVTGTDTNGCVNTDTVLVRVNGLPNVDAGANVAVCKKTSAVLKATGAATYLWSPPTGLSCTSCANPTASPLVTTTYTVTGTDSNDCVNSDSVTLSIKVLPTVVAGPDTALCAGMSSMIVATGALSYNWYPSTGLSCSNCDTAIVSPTATTTYKVIGTAANGCKDTEQVLLTVHQLPVITTNHDTAICDGSSYRLSVSGAKQYKWSPATGLSCATCTNPIANPSANATYTVVGTDAFGCVDSNKVSLTLIKKQPVAVWKDDTICQGRSTQLNASGGTSYTWWPPQTLSNYQIADPTATPDVTTIYKVIIKQGGCFTDSGNVKVVVMPIPTVTVSADRTITAGSSIQLDATIQNAISYEWSPPDGLSCIYCANPIATPKKKTIYTIHVVGFEGCDAAASITIDVVCANSQIFIPNTFTPNGDGKNDVFYPSGEGIDIVKRFSVYDRWGELVYEAHNFPLNDPKYGWDGTYKGKTSKPDVFVYILTAVCEVGQLIQLKGDISVVK